MQFVVHFLLISCHYYHYESHAYTVHTHSMETHSMEKVPSMENFSINQTE